MTPFENIYSLDIETTGLSPREYIDEHLNAAGNKRKARIWSIGVASKSGSSYGGAEAVFEADKTGANKKAEYELLKNNPFYQKGDYAEYASGKKIIDPNYHFFNGDTDIPSFLNSQFNSKSSGMVLIQNMSFERSFLDSVDGVRDSSLISRFHEQATGGIGTKIYAPSEVTNAKSKLYEAAGLKQRDAIYDEVMAAYQAVDERVRNAPGTHFYAADLMDFSKATWTKAAAQGFIPESFVTTGTNMEFLSKLLLGEEEVHGALSDATQQIKVFEKLGKIRSELVNNNPSPEVLDLFKHMKIISGTIKERAAAKSVLSNIDKLSRGGVIDASEHYGFSNVSVVDQITDQTKQVKVRKSNYNLSREAGLAKLSKVIADNYGGTQAQKLFEAVLESNNYDGQAVYQALQNKDFRNRIQTIFDDTNSIITRVMDDPENISKDDIRVMRLNNSNQTDRTASAIMSKTERLYQEARDSSEFLRSVLPKSHKKGLAGIAATAGLGLLYLSTDTIDDDLRVKHLKQKQEELDMRQYNDPTFRQFYGMDINRPLAQDYAAMPAGVARANREAFNRHHE